MKCPHCQENFHEHVLVHYLESDKDGTWGVKRRKCPACERFVLSLIRGPWLNGQFARIDEERLFRPKQSLRAPAPPEVPKDLADDYSEACLVLADSPKASASLSRRCLQHLLRDHVKVRRGDLVDEIQEAIDNHSLPSHLAESIDAVRNIGNFATHPIKSRATGEIVPVEPGEAEWNLDVLESFFDYLFVQPARLKAKRDALNKKLSEVGKPPMR
jgi:hypothetical protein